MAIQADWISVASLRALEDKPLVEVTIAGVRLLVARYADRVTAVDAFCTHDLAPLCGGTIENGYLVCPRHRARFELATGRIAPGFNIPSLVTYPTRIRAGAVQIDASAVQRTARIRHPVRWDLTE